MERLINGVVDGSRKSIPINAGDYERDGLLYCGKCDTPKQTRITIFGIEKKPMCICRCEADRRKAEEEKDARAAEERRRKSLRQWGFPDAEMQAWTFARDDGKSPEVMRWARRYAETFPDRLREGKGLLLYGPCGTGKTFAAACIANDLIDRGYSCLVTSFARIGNTLQSEKNRQDFLDGLAAYSLLVIDDLGAERNTSYMAEIVFGVIDARYRQKKPLIVTSNVTREELRYPADPWDKRIYSRIFEMCHPAEVTGADRRKADLRERYAREEALLNGE